MTGGGGTETPGESIGIIKDGSTVLCEGFGTREEIWELVMVLYFEEDAAPIRFKSRRKTDKKGGCRFGSRP